MDGEVSAEALRELLAADADVQIVDIRPPAAFEAGHIPGSLNLPFARLTDDIEQLEGAGRVVTVCPHGQASVQAARLVAAYEGVDGPVESLACGLEGWDGELQSANDESDPGPAV